MSANVSYSVHRASVARALCKDGIVRVDLLRGFPYTSEGRGPLYCNCRRIQSLPTFQRLIVATFTSHIQGYKDRGECDAIAGVQTGAIPISVLVADRLRLPHCGVRKDPKDTSWIDGIPPEGKKVFLIEDVWNFGRSVRKARERLLAEGATVVGCGVVLTYPNSPDPHPFENLFALSSLDDLEEHLVVSGQLSVQDWDRVRAWRDDRSTWAPTTTY